MITGRITSVAVPASVVVGSDLVIQVAFHAENPEGSLWNPWKTFLIADVPTMGLFELDASRRYSSDVDTGVKTYNLGKVPDISPAPSMAVVLRLFAHSDANYDWDWGEYNMWLDGYAVSFEQLDSEYRFISVTPPGVPPEKPVTFIGEITKVTLKPGADARDARFLISFSATARNWWDAYGAWFTRLTMRMSSYSDSDTQEHIGASGSRTNQELGLGSVTPGTYSAVITLEAVGRIGQWQTLDTYNVTISVSSAGVIEPPEPKPKEGMGIAVPLLIGGGLLLVALVMKPEKKG